MVKVSIALATCNGQAFLRRQLESFVDQARRPDELVIVDDASDDSTMSIVEEFAAAAPFEVKVGSNAARLGYAQNFSRALSRCSGDIVFLSDQDDVWFPNKIGHILKERAKSPQLLYVNDLVPFIGDTALSSDSPSVFDELKRFGRPIRSMRKGCATAVDSRLLSFALPIPLSRPHDIWLHEVASRFQSKTIVRESLQGYRQHEGQESGLRPGPRRRVQRLVRGGSSSSKTSIANLLATLEPLQGRITDEGVDTSCLEAFGVDVDQVRGCIAMEYRDTRARATLTSTPTVLRRLLLLGRHPGMIQASRRAGRGALWRDLLRP